MLGKGTYVTFEIATEHVYSGTVIAHISAGEVLWQKYPEYLGKKNFFVDSPEMRVDYDRYIVEVIDFDNPRKQPRYYVLRESIVR